MTAVPPCAGTKARGRGINGRHCCGSSCANVPEREDIMDDWSNVRLCDVVNLTGRRAVLLTLAVRLVHRRPVADRFDCRDYHRGAVDCCARRFRGVGGMAQPDCRPGADGIALAARLPEQSGDEDRRRDWDSVAFMAALEAWLCASAARMCPNSEARLGLSTK